MKLLEDNAKQVKTPSSDENELTGLPGLRTWRHVYWFVFACFVLWIVLLLVLTMSYS